MQLDFLPNDHAMPVIRETQGRINAMALVHEKLYRSTDLAQVDFAEYLRELTENIICTLRPSSQDVNFILDADDVSLSIDTAVPCGLLVNELITNAYKHGFPSGGPGTLTVTLRRAEDGRIHLQVADTGRGIPEGLNLRETESLGMQLVFTLIDQLEGSIEITTRSGEGTRFDLTFPETHALVAPSNVIQTHA